MTLRLIQAGLALALAVAVIPAAAMAQEPLAGDPAGGEKIYHQICSLCHSNQKGVIKIGPPLYGDYGRVAGTYPGFHYSEQLKAFGRKWDVATLRIWEAGPRKYVPGTKMTFPGLKTDKQINDMIAYLQTLHD